MTTATTVESSSNATRSFVNAKLPDLDYDFSALEPVICAEIMEIHHQKHHNTYVTNFNVAQEKYAEAEAKAKAEAEAKAQAEAKAHAEAEVLARGGHLRRALRELGEEAQDREEAHCGTY